MKFSRVLAVAVSLILALAGRPALGQHAAESADRAGFVIRPYLVAPGQEEMSIAWTAATAEEFVVRFSQGERPARSLTVRPTTQPVEYTVHVTSGPDEASAQPPTTMAEHLYVARLAGLTSGSRYRYEVRPVGRPGQGVAGSFRTFVRPGEPFTFIICGDSQDGRDWAKVAANFARFDPLFIVHVGDLVDRGGYWPNMNTEFFQPLGELAGRVPVMPAVGNHDSRRTLGLLFRQGSGRMYYSFDCGDIHFSCLDTLVGRVNIERMLQWLRSDLAQSKARWKIVYGHFASYDLGSHQMRWGRKDFTELYRQFAVDAVFAGHSHAYQRFRPMFTRGQNESHPITYFVTGAGGGNVHRVAQDPYLAAWGVLQHNFIVADASPNRLAFRAIDADGKEIDRFEIAKDDAGRLAADYVASALPEEDFGSLRALVWPSLSSLKLSDDPLTGRPARIDLDMGAGEKAMTFTLKLERRAAEAFEMEPVSGQSAAGQTTPVSVQVRLRDPGRYGDGQTPVPVLRLECFFEIAGQKGSVFSSRPMFDASPPADPASDQ